MTGAEFAMQMLNDFDIKNVSVRQMNSNSFYSAGEQFITLSEEVYYGTNEYSISVAAHEVGHAIQHKRGYLYLLLYHFLLPIKQINWLRLKVEWNATMIALEYLIKKTSTEEYVKCYYILDGFLQSYKK